MQWGSCYCCPVLRQVHPLPGFQKGHTCWELGAWLRSTLVQPLHSSFPWPAQTRRQLPTTSEAGVSKICLHRAVEGGEVKLVQDKGALTLCGWGRQAQGLQASHVAELGH